MSHDASRTNDGNTSTNEKSCAHTGLHNNRKAWLQVALEKEFSIKNVVIYYRNESKM